MLKKIFDIFKGDNELKIQNGLGVTELPIKVYQGKQPIKSSDFKKIINDIFLPRIQELGFRGRDFFFYRQNTIYTEAIFLWTYKTGGAIQIDLLVKFNEIKYPNDKNIIKTTELRPVNTEFQKRLSPNEEKNKNGQDVWFWIFADDLNSNIKIVEDIWRVFSIRGVEYFEQFKNHKEYIRQVTTDNYLDFPDFYIQRFFGRHEAGIIYFLFEYWRQMEDEERALKFAKLGLTKVHNESDETYLATFQKYLNSKI